jgi:general secretion pathway protein E
MLRAKLLGRRAERADQPGGNRTFDAAVDERLESVARLLGERNLIEAVGLERARRVSSESGTRLDIVMTQLGLVTERALAEAYATVLAVPLVGPDGYPTVPVLEENFRVRFLRHARILPIEADQRGVVLAMVDPLDRFSIEAVGALVERQVSVKIAIPIELEAALGRLYPDGDGGGEAGGDLAGPGRSDSESVENDTERLKDLASEAPVIRLVNQLIARAVETRASDIHIEPFEDRVRIRYRHDGLLREVEAPAARLQAAIVSRIKIMARLDIAERRLPQDGRIKLVVRGHEVDFRVSTIPALHGESVVLRVLDRSSVEFNFSKLGLPEDIGGELRTALEAPNGIVLVTGPTGSGKTTTLYTGLLHLNATTRKVVTVEDPVEYQLAGINQVQVKPQIGLNFATLLRSILRHDPDVIMIGEIRDLETAEIAVQASLTGHLVLSTLHTNSAAATVTRLRDMGVEDYLLTATLNAVLAQRLVRRLCPLCKRPAKPAPGLTDGLDLQRYAGGQPLHLFEAVGCGACNGTGYAGRIAIAELLRVDQSIQQLVLSRADQAAIQRAAVAGGMRTLYESGIREVIAGITTLPEVLRSIRGED